MSQREWLYYFGASGWLGAVFSVLFLLANYAAGGVLALWPLLIGTFLGAWSTSSGSPVTRAKLASLSTLLHIAVIALLAAMAPLLLGRDGDAYYQLAIESLVGGWNPITGANTPPAVAVENRIYAFGKAAWFYGALLAQQGSPHFAKALSPYLCLLNACLFFAIFRKWSLPVGFAGLFASALAFHPTALSQVFTFYVDGIVGSALVLLVVASLDWLRGEEDSIGYWLMAAGTTIAACTKLNGLAHAGILWFFFLGAAAATKQLFPRRRSLGKAMAAAALGCAIVGYTPYFENLRAHGNPFHPMFTFSGPKLYDYETNDQVPEGLIGRSHLAKFYKSLSSEVGGMHAGYQPKFPLWVSSSEIRILKLPDPRVSGFGPWFFASLLASFLLLASVRKSKPRSPLLTGLFALTWACALSGIFCPESWWTRFIPQFAAVPALVGMSAYFKGANPARVYALVGLIIGNLLWIILGVALPAA
jgi:hypothetical protein